MPPSIEVLEQRLRTRDTETEESIQRRMGKAAKELSVSDQFDVELKNDDLERVKAEAMELLDQFLKG